MADSQVTLAQRENDVRFSSEPSSPNRHECVLCLREIEQDGHRRWFFSDAAWTPTFRSDFVDAFQTQQGWICSTSCFNDHAVEAEQYAGLFLIQGGAA